ncbi:hypothetical protein [Salinarimonas chemoclinalis]|uniref:hypothetical protein n=1 Tax=Salinarimonas chemoclinalis TaxID=3241599 RepID=UPI003558496D
MLYRFPPGTTATVIADYERPYPDPIAVRAGDLVVPDAVRSAETDILGWTWCTGPDGRAGWTPTAWTAPAADGRLRMIRDFSALEHTVRRGDRATLHHSESGFVWATVNGSAAWVPDAVLAVEPRP